MNAALKLLGALGAAALVATLFSVLWREPPQEGPLPLLEIRDISLPFLAREQPQPEEPIPTEAVSQEQAPPPARHSFGEDVSENKSEIEGPEPTPVADVKPQAPLEIPGATQLSDQEFYARYANAVIQVYCRSPKEVSAASGVIVNERGLVLTNAHVAEIVTKAGRGNCQARRGNPAEAFAGLEVVFSADTSSKIADTEVPQRDLAFLRLLDPKKFFSIASFDFGLARAGETFLTLGYPSEFLQGVNAEINSNLVFSILTPAGLSDLDGDSSTAEAYVFRGGLALQQGSSGTALFRRSGGIVGLIFATTKGATTADRDGVAFSVPYMDRIMRLETGEDLREFIKSH